MAKTSKNPKPTKQGNEKLKKTAETGKRASQARENRADGETVNLEPPEIECVIYNSIQLA
jgi:hypothetical protein